MLSNEQNFIFDSQEKENESFKEYTFNKTQPFQLQSKYDIQNLKKLKSEFGLDLNDNYLKEESFIKIKFINQNDKPTKITTKEEKSINEEINLSKEQKKKVFNRDNYNVNFIEKNKNNNEKKICGRKRKNDNTIGIHNKYSDDNIRRKCKHLVLNSVMEFINEKIKIIYNGNIGNNILKKELLTLNKSQKHDANINNNKTFLEKNIGEIFSDRISARFTNYLPEHNKLLILRLKTEKDENKRLYFSKLFDLTFLQCLKHYRGSDFIEELDGLKCFKEIKNEISIEKEYIDLLEYYLKNFERIINNKKPRKSRKVKKK